MLQFAAAAAQASGHTSVAGFFKTQAELSAEALTKTMLA